MTYRIEFTEIYFYAFNCSEATTTTRSKKIMRILLIVSKQSQLASVIDSCKPHVTASKSETMVIKEISFFDVAVQFSGFQKVAKITKLFEYHNYEFEIRTHSIPFQMKTMLQNLVNRKKKHVLVLYSRRVVPTIPPHVLMCSVPQNPIFSIELLNSLSNLVPLYD